MKGGDRRLFLPGMLQELGAEFAAGQQEALESQDVATGDPFELFGGDMSRREAAKTVAKVSVATMLTAGATSRLEAGEEYPYQLTSANGRTTIDVKYIGYSDGQFQLEIKGGKAWRGGLNHFDANSQTLLRNLAGLNAPEAVEVSETGFPREIEIISRGQERGRVVRVEDISPKDVNVPVSQIQVNGKWHSLDGTAGGLNVDQKTLDAIEAAREYPVGDVRVYGYNLALEEPDASAFEGVKCRAVKCTEWDVYGIREDGVLISTREQPTTPDGEPIQNVHWIDRFAHDTLIVKTAGGMVYKIVGDSKRAEIIGSGPMDIVRKDQVALFGTYVTNGSRIERDPESESAYDAETLETTAERRGGKWSEIFYVPIGYVKVGRDGRVQVVQDESSSSSGLEVTVDTSAIALEDTNVVCVGSNKLGEIVVVSRGSGGTQVTTYSPTIKTSHASDHSLRGAEIVYARSNTSSEFATKTRSLDSGFSSTQVTHIAGNGNEEVYLSSKTGFMAWRALYNLDSIPQDHLPTARERFTSPHSVEFEAEGLTGITPDGRVLSPGVSTGVLGQFGVLPEDQAILIERRFFLSSKHIRDSGGVVAASTMRVSGSQFSDIPRGHHSILKALILRPKVEGDAMASTNAGK